VIEMKVTYQFWRRIEVRQICQLEVDVPDDLANDRYLADHTAAATLRTYEKTMAWENDGPLCTTESGYVRCAELPPEAD
jgi:hypothetical protein